ncbi:MAG: hypothetical protein A2939_04105 [Parcubacteria group bacterium RIFCSPLOWO2_01_FULL_48_18]|nr:MAG: hypothetical protein A3J67_05315 [Parcubacteria group bacterium RIFCSPHIGHO2_02_FULL_48_10b]OHB22762.1 MAG: hypothetical protein A2939_04105 [Parcubacteria group bacterium RIFCSPLOWO2_01_FULL_48_18]
MISLAAVNITEKTKELMNTALRDGEIGQGRYIAEFEDAIKNFVGIKYAVAVASGTVADAIILAALKYLRPEKNEVILPALTFIAHVNATYYNQLTPVFVDATADLQIDASQIERKITKNTLAIMPVDLLGNPAPMDEILFFAQKHDLFVVTDSCEAFGAKYKGGMAGAISHAGTYSFFPSHTITCGEGGMIVTNDEKIAGLAVQLRNHGRKSNAIEDKFTFPMIGFNGKMNCLEAIIGLGAVESLPKYIKARHEAYLYLKNGLGVDILRDSKDKYIVPHGFPLLFKNRAERDAMLKKIFRAGIECRKIFSSIPTQEESYLFLGYKKGKFPVAEDIANRGLYLPAHQNLSEDDLEEIVRVVKPLLS